MSFLTSLFSEKRNKIQTELVRKREKLCKNAKTQYIPNGLLKHIPEVWNCTFDEGIHFKGFVQKFAFLVKSFSNSFIMIYVH